MQPDDDMYQIFEIKIKFQNEDSGSGILDLGWSVNGNEFMKMNDEYVMLLLNLNKKTLRCLITDIFVLEEEEWKKEDYPNREKIIENALEEIKNLFLNAEIESVERKIKRV